ncbi:MAG: NADP-dependent oxidoreductase [Thermocrispum sp.]
MTETPQNLQCRLAARPVGEPKPSDWEFTTEPAGEPAEGQLLVRNRYLSLDPAMRGWMNAGKSYIPPVELGEVMRAGAVGEVVSSLHDGFRAGELVQGNFGVQEYAVSDGRGVVAVEGDDPTHYLGVLGIGGLTAYFGLFDVGRPEPGQTVVVSGAAGAVGSIAGQLAKIHGCRVVGVAGGPDKCRMVVEEFGFDACIDYRADDVPRRLRELAPDGVDVFFDNVGGPILEAVLGRLARGARVAICGAISQYNATELRGPRNYMQLLVTRSSMAGFVVFDYAKRYPEAREKLAGWLGAGRLTVRETVVDGGIHDFPATLNQLFTGANTGKLILALS